MMYHYETAKQHAEQVLNELERIERFIRNAKKALNNLNAQNEQNAQSDKNINPSINNTNTNTNTNNAKEKNENGQIKQSKKTEENKQYLQIVQNIYSGYFNSLPSIEYQRLTSAKSLLDGADVYRQLLKQGYTKQHIEQAIYSARRDAFWSNQFRSMRKLLRKNRDGVLYMDVFLALNQSSHKLSVPKIIR